MLLSAHFLDERTLIVLDEPEVHLHPNWQLKYAEIITLLVKNNINFEWIR
jgi:predicted ATPase